MLRLLFYMLQHKVKFRQSLTVFIISLILYIHTHTRTHTHTKIMHEILPIRLILINIKQSLK